MGPNDALVAGSVLCNTCAIPYIPVKRNHAFTNKKQKKTFPLYFTFCAEPLGTTTLQNGRNLFIAFFSYRYIFAPLSASCRRR